jgi:hypothetical protein
MRWPPPGTRRASPRRPNGAGAGRPMHRRAAMVRRNMAGPRPADVGPQLRMGRPRARPEGRCCATSISRSGPIWPSPFWSRAWSRGLHRARPGRLHHRHGHPRPVREGPQDHQRHRPGRGYRHPCRERGGGEEAGPDARPPNSRPRQRWPPASPGSAAMPMASTSAPRRNRPRKRPATMPAKPCASRHRAASTLRRRPIRPAQPDHRQGHLS